MTSSRRRTGFSLMVVLWLLIALGTIMVELSVIAQSSRTATINTVDAVRARAASEAGIAAARARLARADAGTLRNRTVQRRGTHADPWRGAALLVHDTVVIGYARAYVWIRDAGSAVQVNLASEAALRALLVALRVDAGDADRIAQVTMDWIDADDARRARGAERETYLRTSREVLPTNRPMRSLAELQHVHGMTDEVLQRVLPYLTLHGSGQVSINSAERPVLLTLPGMTEEAVIEILRRQRAKVAITDLDELARSLGSGARARFVANLPALRARTTLETRELEMSSVGFVEGSRTRVTTEALLVRVGGSYAGEVSAERGVLVGKRAR